MKGFFVNTPHMLSLHQPQQDMDGLTLLCKHGNMEIMQQELAKGAVVWMEPTGDPEELEFFYLVSGALTCRRGSWVQHLEKGDSFYIRGLVEEFSIEVIEDTLLVYVSNTPLFGDSQDFQTTLRARLDQIDEKDHYTTQHSRNVMQYSLALRGKLEKYCTATYGDLAIAALFHDIGKCVIPDDILKKPARLTREEYDLMKTHAAATREILGPYYDETICDMAGNHHERLDGSGYPRGLKGEALSFESRLIAVTDAFDAMISRRGYNRVMTPETAARELAALPEQYDARVTAVLLDMIQSGELAVEQVK